MMMNVKEIKEYGVEFVPLQASSCVRVAGY